MYPETFDPEVFQSVVGDAGAWAEFTGDELVSFATDLSCVYGITYEAGMIMVASELFPMLARDISVDLRLGILARIRANIEVDQNIHAMAFLPLVICDDHVAVVSSAVIDLLAFSEFDEKRGALFGVSELNTLVQKRVPRNIGGVLAGLIVYGDTRLVPAMLELVGTLTQGEIQVASQARSELGIVTHAAIDFWMAACELFSRKHDVDAEAKFGLAASALVLLQRSNKDGTVKDVIRHSPVTKFDPSIEVVKSWEWSDYILMQRDRLKSIADAEVGEKVMPRVMDAWGL